MEMDKEVANPNRPPLFIRWIPYIEESKMQYLYPINETTVFQRSTKSELLSSLKKAETFTKPNIYTQLYEKRLTDKGEFLFNQALENESKRIGISFDGFFAGFSISAMLARERVFS